MLARFLGAITKAEHEIPLTWAGGEIADETRYLHHTIPVQLSSSKVLLHLNHSKARRGYQLGNVRFQHPYETEIQLMPEENLLLQPTECQTMPKKHPRRLYGAVSALGENFRWLSSLDLQTVDN
jgi:hypothetical protein